MQEKIRKFHEHLTQKANSSKLELLIVYNRENGPYS
jgi:hypothetical protein